MKTLKITAKNCVIEDFITEEEIEFAEIVDKAKKIANSLPSHSVVENELCMTKKVISIDYNEAEMSATINYELVTDTMLNNYLNTL